MKKILIAGAHGMVGRNIVEHLNNNKDYELLTPNRSELDLTNEEEVNKYMAKHKPDMIIHCAGVVGGIQANIKYPIRFLVDNTRMGLNVVMGGFNNNVKTLINLGSSCMYPINITGLLKEEDILKGELESTNEGYAIAKNVIAKLTTYISNEHKDYKYKTIIPCNLYGKYDKFGEEVSHMLPAVIKKIYDAHKDNKRQVEIWGDGLARREFLYASDLAEFINYSIDHIQDMPNVINVGAGEDKSINEYYKITAEVIGYQGEFIHNLNKPVGVKQKLMDVSKLQSFGWNFKTSLEDGIRETYEYFKVLK